MINVIIRKNVVGEMKKENDFQYRKPGEFKSPEEELSFLLWKAELNKELLCFWKSISK
jgi:hypothetical protein